MLKKIYKKIRGFAKKNLKFTVIAAFVLVLALLSLVLALTAGIIPAIVADIVLIVICGGILLTDKLSVRWWTREKPPGFFQDLRWRNVPGLVVGSTKAWKYIDFTRFGDQIYNCVTYKRSFHMDFAMLKTYFSHVKKDGKIFIVFDYSEAEELGWAISPRDWSYIHPHLFLALGKTADKKKNSHPLFYYPKQTIGYVCTRIIKKLGFYKNATWKRSNDMNLDIDTGKVQKRIQAIDKMLCFCWERDLVPELILINGSSENNCANEIIRATFAPKYYQLDVKTVDNAGELNNYINQKIQQ